MTPQSLIAPARLAGRPVLRSQSDERLVDLVRSGSEPAFEAIVARYRAPLLRYCGRILPEGRAEDAVQQAFVSAFRAIRRDDSPLDLRPWLYRIAHNTALNALRDRGLRHAELDERIDGVERPDQALERRQALNDVLVAVKALPERQRDAVVLRELEGRSYEEIAGELGISGGAVRQLLNRARNTLRAGVSAVTPFPLVLRLSSDAGDPAARVGELVGAGGAGALATKLVATALVTGVFAGGIATVPGRHGDDRAKADAVPGAPAPEMRETDSATAVSAGERRPGATGRDRGAGDDDPHGDRHGDRSGPGSGDRREGDRSGSDDGHSSGGDDRSGSGESGSGDSGSGSRSGSGSSDGSGSGSGVPGDGSGSGTSGTSSTSGTSGTSGSGSSGSGTSGDGGSGSASGSGGISTTTTSTTTESTSGETAP